MFLISLGWRSVALSFLVAAVLFGLAGRMDIVGFWAYFGVFLAASLLGVRMIDKDLIRERCEPEVEGATGRTSAAALSLLALMQWSLAALDVGRFHWSSPLPPALQAGSLVAFGALCGVVLWALRVNRYFSSVIRMQTDRGQTVVSEGPYRAVRHPGYSAVLFGWIAGAFSLGSLAALLPGILIVPVVLLRTAREDRILLGHLPGYASYSADTPFRIFPGLW